MFVNWLIVGQHGVMGGAVRRDPNERPRPWCPLLARNSKDNRHQENEDEFHLFNRMKCYSYYIIFFLMLKIQFNLGDNLGCIYRVGALPMTG